MTLHHTAHSNSRAMCKHGNHGSGSPQMQAKCCCPTNYTYMAAYKAHRTMCRAQAWLAEVSKSGDGCESTAISSPLLRLGLLQLWLLLGLLASAASLLECPA